jgi:hypothetical protein
LGNDNPPFSRKQRDAAMRAAVDKWWNFPNPAAAAEIEAEAATKVAAAKLEAEAAKKADAEAVATAHSMDGKKGAEERRKILKTTPHAEEAVELIKTQRMKPKKSSTHNISNVLAEKFGASYKTWTRFINAAEDEGMVPKQLKI